VAGEDYLRNLIEFCRFAGKLKRVKRTGWVERVGIKDGESVADHSYRVALMAMVLSDKRKLDTEKIMRMALLHDLGESVIGDWDALKTRLEGREAEKRRKEDEAMRGILALLPKELEEEYLAVWREVEARETEESKLFRQVDRLETLIQASEYQMEGYDKKKFEGFSGARRSVTDEELLRIVELLDKEVGKNNLHSLTS